MRSIGSINENEWKGKPARLLGTSWFSRLCLRRRAGGSAERTLSAGILFRKHILMQNELPAVSDRPIQPENLKPVLITRSKVGETRQLEREPGCRGSPPCRTGVQRHCPCLPLPRVRKWVKLASWNANRGPGGHPLPNRGSGALSLPSPATRSKVGETRQLEREPGSRGTAPGGGYLEAFQASI